MLGNVVQESTDDAVPAGGTAAAEQQRIAEQSRAEPSAPRWLLYRYTRPAIIMGRSQRPGAGQLARADRHDLPLVHRRSGGGAVMAGPQMLSLTVFLPAQHAITCGSAVAAYNWLGDSWREALAAAGVGSRICDIDEARRSQQNARDVGAEWACYSSVSHGELVTADGRKLLGLAQIRNRYCTVLTSGVYLDSPNWALLASVVTGGLDNADYLAGYNASLSGESGVDSRELVGTLSAVINATLRDRLATAGSGHANN